jgi:hypothetical protein
MRKHCITGQRGAVEVLAEGQQVLVHGWHPLSLSGNPVMWYWHRDRAPWSVPVSDLPVVSHVELDRFLADLLASGLLGAPLVRTQSTTVRQRFTRSVIYPATRRLNELFATHGGLVKPAVRELIAEVGAAGCGRHDALVAICGRLVFQRWDDKRALGFLAPLINRHFGDGDWTKEIQDALGHARRCEAARLSDARTTT